MNQINFERKFDERFDASLAAADDAQIPEYRNLQFDALSGDMVLEVTPATVASSAAAVNTAIAGDGWSRNVTISLKNAAGVVHNWFNGQVSIAVSENASGASAIAGGATTVTLVNGVGTIAVTRTGSWATGNVETVTVSATLLNNLLTSKTSVDTLVA